MVLLFDRNEVINQYITSLRSSWIRSFGKQHTELPKTIISQLQYIMRSYSTRDALSKGSNQR